MISGGHRQGLLPTTIPVDRQVVHCFVQCMAVCQIFGQFRQLPCPLGDQLLFCRVGGLVYTVAYFTDKAAWTALAALGVAAAVVVGVLAIQQLSHTARVLTALVLAVGQLLIFCIGRGSCIVLSGTL